MSRRGLRGADSAATERRSPRAPAASDGRANEQVLELVPAQSAGTDDAYRRAARSRPRTDRQNSAVL